MGMSDIVINEKDRLCNLIVQEGACQQDVEAVMEVLEEKYDFDWDVALEKLAQCAIGIRILSLMQVYSQEQLWHHWKDFVTELDGEGEIDKVWKAFKGIAQEHDL